MEKHRYMQLRQKYKFPLKKGYLLRHGAGDLFLLSASFLLFRYFADSYLRFLSVPILACLMFRSFSLMHEAVHGLASDSKWINESVGIVAGALCLLPYGPWKQVHLHHHFWSGNIEKDPVMAIVRRFPRLSPAVQNLLSAVWKSWLPGLAFLQQMVFWSASIKEVLKINSKLNIVSLLVPLLFGAVVLSVVPNEVLLSAVLPAIALYLVAVEVVNFPHHLSLPQNQGDVRLPVWQQFQVSRSCKYPKWVANYIVLNFNYHSEHHVFPDAPWYYLADLHEVLKTELKDAYNQDEQFAWILKYRFEDLGEVIKPIPSKVADKVSKAA